MRRWRPWLLAAGAVILLVGVALALLPAGVRYLAAQRLEAMTGRDVAIENVDLNLFTRRLAIVGVRVAGRADETPLARLERLDARFELPALVRGQVVLERLALAGLELHVVRRPDGTFTVDDVLERLARQEPREAPLGIALAHLTLEGGQAVLEDQAVAPARAWRLDRVTLEARDLTTITDAANGTLAGAFTLAGAAGAVAADGIGLRPPLRARASVSLGGLDLAPLAAYMADAPVVLAGGRFAGTERIRFEGGAIIAERGQATIEELVLRRPGQDEPLVTADALVMTSSGVRYAGGEITAGRLELATSVTVTEELSGTARAHAIRDLRLVVQDARVPGPTPARVTLTTALPAGGSLDARGTARFFPPAADLVVRLADVDLALARPYLPADAPVAYRGGLLETVLDLDYDGPSTLVLAGDFAIRDLALFRAGQSPPVVRHRRLQGTIAGLRLHGRDLAIERLALSGAPVVIDASVTPPQRYDLASLSLAVHDFTWPAARPARVTGAARLREGAVARLEARVDPSTLATEARLRVSRLALPRLQPYLGRGAPVAVIDGTASGTVSLRHQRRSGVRLDATGTLESVAVAPAGGEDPFFTAPSLRFEVDALTVGDGAVAGRRVTVTGAPTITEPAGSRERPVAFRHVAFTVEDLVWPASAPARVRLVAELPESGQLTSTGTLDLGRRRVALSVQASDAAVGPLAGFVPVEAPLRGRLDAQLDVQGDLGTALRLHVAGRAAARTLALGPPGQAPIEVARIEVEGLDVRWPERVQVDRVGIVAPRALVERTAEGQFPLRAMLGGDRSGEPEGDSPAASPGRSPAIRTPVEIIIGEIAVVDGEARFVDRTTTPDFSEEIRHLALSVRDVSSRRDEPARVALQGVLGADAAIDLQGVLEPFGRPFFLEVEGELRQFSVPRTNPYLRRFLSWIARGGELTTKLHYRIVGREIAGSNEIVVHGLDVERVRGEEVGRTLGLPLALVVSVLKDRQGDIRLSVPISGELGSLRFGLRDAITTFLRRLVGKVATSPFAAIGRIFRTGDDGDGAVALDVEPLPFGPGEATIGPEASRHLQRVADFLRASPYVEMVLRPVVTASDLEALRARQVAARVQQAQRESGLDFASAAIRLYQQRFPERVVPTSVNDMLEALRAEVPPPEAMARALAARRLEAARRFLVDAAGIEPPRLVEGDAPPLIGAAGTPRVDFALEP